MSLESLLTLTATITRRTQTGPTDRYNVPTWVTTTTTAPCYREQTSATEDTVGRETQEATHKVVFGPDMVIDGSDLVAIDGVTYEVIGPAQYVWNPRTARLHNVAVQVKELSE